VPTTLISSSLTKLEYIDVSTDWAVADRLPATSDTKMPP